jgi:preprotein translocase subunit SecY
MASFFLGSQTEWVANMSASVQSLFGGTSNAYWVIYFFMVVGFTFFYTDVLFAQQNYGENLKKVGAQIPGVSRGARTQKYLTTVLRRITLPGALFLGLVAILPWLIGLVIPFGANTGLLLVSSAGLLIVVGVVRDTFFNIEAELKLHGYDDSLLIR